MNFSFVLPSRGEKKALLKMLDSFERTTKYIRQIEFLIAVDPGMKQEVDVFIKEKQYRFRVVVYERRKTKDFTNDYYNWMADKTRGKNIIAFNDDAWMRTNNWDEKILKTIKQYGRTVYMLDLLDTARLKYGNQFPCFPCISRRAFCTLGFLLHKDVPIYPADKVTHSVYFQCNRIIPIMNVLIEHEHLVETDNSKSNMWELYQEWQKDFKGVRKDGVYGIPQINIGDDVLKLSKVAQSDGPLRLNKLTRIINILKER